MTEKIGKYEIRLPLGRGGMGVVYEGFDPAIGRRVAIKTLRTENIDPDELPEFLARFKREAQSAGRLSHPHIVTIYEYGEQDGMPYIVMEYIAGRDLSVDLKRGVRFDVDEVVRLMTQLLSALGHAHEHAVVHRDIKPQNILLLDDGSLKVVDFGIARLEDGDSFTKTGLAIGTPAYMAPEQVMGQKVTAKSDLFSCGTLLYQLLTGDRPFTGDEYSVKQKILKLEPIRPSELNPLLLPPWDAVVARAMAKRPEARYDSARQFLEAVRSAHEADRRSSEEQRRKTKEAEEHALREAQERSQAEARRREDQARREAAAEARAQAEVAAKVALAMEAERAAKLEVEARAARDSAVLANKEAAAATAPARSGGRGWMVGAGVISVVIAIGASLYAQKGAKDETAKAEAARVAAEAIAKEEVVRREKVEALAREEAAQRTKLEADARRQAEVAEKARTEEEARKAVEETARALSLKKEETRKAELAAKKEAETRKQAELAANREAEEKVKVEEAAKAEAARKAAEARAATRRPGFVFQDCPSCPRMVVISAGEFTMGSPVPESERDADDVPQRMVRIGQPFAIGRTEVTQGEWRAVMGSNPSGFANCGDDCPVERVDWREAQEYARRLSEKTGKQYRLPSEAEWEYACRAGSHDRYCGGGDIGGVAWYAVNSGDRTTRVGQKRRNAFGLYDMSGNVREWTADCWNSSYAGAPSIGEPLLSGDCSLRVVRGGAWDSAPRLLRSVVRGGESTNYRLSNLGFRLVRLLE